MKIQQRIALIFALLMMSIVLVVSLTQYYFANQNTFEDFYKRLEIRAIVVARTKLEKNSTGKKAYEEIRNMHLETLPYEKEYLLSIQNLSHDISSYGLKAPRSFFIDAMRDGKSRYRDHDMFYYGYLYTDSRQVDHIVVVSARNEFIASYLNNLLRAIVISFLVVAIVAVLTGIWFSSIILRPVRIIARKMKEITATQLHHRLHINKGKDEIANLAETFNNMLDRLEATFETQKNFISNASHELNTPLTTIIGESEYTLSKPRGVNEYTASLETILHEAERLKGITNSLLRIAQTGYNGKTQELVELRLDEIIYSVKEAVDNIIPDNKAFINLSLIPEDQGKLLVMGNQQLLELALVNLVINGCKYSENQPVSITLAATNSKAIIVVEDHGIGIPASEIAYIYEPFFRASNTGKYNGYGIGMPLSRNIIRMHEGELEVNSIENAGTTIKVTLPLSRQ
ncbi:MAG: HAMP domain-containing histidine kinase [Sphingobacteriales bacterium]|nr:MAG: HAMP domain-containing histidine kinase [Sphingobacteriales bacterium]